MSIEGFDKRRREYKHLGWVYVAQNSCFVDKVFKIGQTQTSPSERMDISVRQPPYTKNLISSTLYMYPSIWPPRICPSGIERFPAKSWKRIFNAPLMTIVKTLDEAGNLFQTPLVKTQHAGMLPPALEKQIVSCPKCKKKSRVPLLGIGITVTCTACNAPYKVIHD